MVYGIFEPGSRNDERGIVTCVEEIELWRVYVLPPVGLKDPATCRESTGAVNVYTDKQKPIVPRKTPVQITPRINRYFISAVYNNFYLT